MEFKTQVEDTVAGGRADKLTAIKSTNISKFSSFVVILRQIKALRFFSSHHSGSDWMKQGNGYSKLCRKKKKCYVFMNIKKNNY